MQGWRKFVSGLVVALGMLVAAAAPTQVVATTNLQYTWTATSMATAGQLGSYIVFNNTNASRPIYNTFQVATSGTAPSACTFQVEYSQDGVTWTVAQMADGTFTQITNPPSCAAALTGLWYLWPTVYMRIHLVSFTAGDSTTVVKFYWTGGGK